MTTDTRIESLESQVRTLKRVVYGACGLLLVGGLLAATSMQSVPDVLRAKSFQVMNADGKPAADIIVLKDGTGAVRILNKEERPVVAIGMDAGGGVIGILNNDLKSVVHINAHAPSGGGRLSISNEDGVEVGVIQTTKYGGLISVLNKNSKPAAHIFANNGGGRMDICKDDGQSVVSLFASPSTDGDGAIVTLDSKGEVSSITP